MTFTLCLLLERPFYATQIFLSLGAVGTIYNAARNGDGERPELTAYLRTEEGHGLQAQRAPVVLGFHLAARRRSLSSTVG